MRGVTHGSKYVKGHQYIVHEVTLGLPVQLLEEGSVLAKDDDEFRLNQPMPLPFSLTLSLTDK